MKIIKFFFEIATWLALAVIAVMGLYILTSNFNVFAGYKSFLVQSGSMEPAIMTGDIIIIRSYENYLKNDTITFHGSEGRVVTHRIVDIVKKDGKNYFSTKGDANRSQDEDSITQDQIMGKVVLVIPKLGYLVAFSKSLPGLIILALFPAVLFILDELLKVKNA